MKVAVAMSGGVDSSVTAALLLRAGHDVIGITMKLWNDSINKDRSLFGSGSERCIQDAQQTAEQLGIHHYVLDCTQVFREYVTKPFVTSYQQCYTPNPCVNCNQFVKFGALLDFARQQGADHLATGHYAQIRRKGDVFSLYKGVEAQKDQSYFLYTLTQEHLAHCLFPLGGFYKSDVRKLAQELDLKVAAKSDSQDICFLPDGNYKTLLKHEGHFSPGDIVDQEGRVVGKHQGLPFYTVGQRKGLGVSASQPLYVLALDAVKNRLIVGSELALYCSELNVDKFHFIETQEAHFPYKGMARIRYQGQEAEAVVSCKQEGYRIVFSTPQRAVTAGQSIVFYQENRVVGGGVIKLT